MGGAVKGAVNAVVAPVVTTVKNVAGDIKDRKPLTAVGDIAGVGTGKGGGVAGYASAIVVGAGKAAVTGAYSDVVKNPGAAVADVGAAYATGGASLLAGAEQSILTSAGSLSPGELQKAGGGAPVLPSSPPIAGVNSSAAGGGGDYTTLIVVGAGLVLLVMLLKR